MPTPGAPRPQTPGELQEVLAAERAGAAFLVVRGPEGEQRIVALPDSDLVTIGRRSANDIAVDWDPEVSRVHAELRRVGGEWAVGDQGLSRNGTFVRGERIRGLTRLRDGDGLRVGETLLLFRDPGSGQSAAETAAGAAERIRPELTSTQRRVLAALCRPIAAGDLAVPATNADIAAEVMLSPDRVKGHMRDLFRKFALADLPQNRKRAALADLALREGHVTDHDLASGR